MTVKELHLLARQYKIKYYYKFKKLDLINAIQFGKINLAQPEIPLPTSIKVSIPFQKINVAPHPINFLKRNTKFIVPEPSEPLPTPETIQKWLGEETNFEVPHPLEPLPTPET